ncbi:MAG: MlaD family protein [Paludibacteraceae bacterium]|nr:MlaD family protein [Paludibacteraceae bacterium]
MKYAREIKVGVLAVVCIFLLFFGFNFLKGVNIFSSMYSFHGVYDNIHGLEEQAPVLIRGYKVGQVDKIHYDFTKDSAFIVDVSINRDIDLPRGTQMALVADGLLGSMAIELQLPATYSDNLCKSGETLPTTYIPGLVENLQVNLLASLENTIDGVDSLVNQLNGQLANDHLANTLANVDNISSDLTTVSHDLKGLMRNQVPQIVSNADTAVHSIKLIAADINRADISGTVARVDSAVAQVNTTLADINSDNGTLGLLLHDKSLYMNIDATVVSADSLLTDLKANPKRYVHFSLFGKKDKKK